MKPEKKSLKIDNNVAREVLRRVSRYRALLIISVFFAFVYSAGALYVPILIGRAIDYAVGPGKVNFESVLRLLSVLLAVVSVCAFSHWMMNIINNRVSYKVLGDIRNEAFAVIDSLPVSYIDSHPHGDIVSRVVSDADAFADGLLIGFSQFFTGIVTIVGTFICMLIINYKIALVVAFLSPISMFAARIISKKSFTAFKKQAQVRGIETDNINETLNNQRIVKAFSKEKDMIRAFDDVNRDLYNASLKAVFLSSLTNPATRFVNSIIFACVAFMGAMAVTNKAFTVGGALFTVGSLASLLAYANSFTKPFNEISGVVTELQNALACASRIFDITNMKTLKEDSSDQTVLENVKGRVEFKDVFFSYVKDKPLIKNFNLSAEPGKHVAIVGPTGCGKTTIINLIMRFYDIDKGNIAIDNIASTAIKTKSLRSSFGMVLQDTWIKSGTVRENIAFSKPDASDEEIIDAAKKARAHSFIRRLSKGYDTVLPENGEGLSQGQKQLLSIARVMLALPPMLILDEATSNIDTRTELEIQKAFGAMMKGRTSFIVAHRLSTIQNADIIVVMRDGKIVEQGNHEELLLKNGFYSELYNSSYETTSEDSYK